MLVLICLHFDSLHHAFRRHNACVQLYLTTGQKRNCKNKKNRKQVFLTLSQSFTLKINFKLEITNYMNLWTLLIR